MTVTDAVESWREAFEARDIDVEQTEGPDASERAWFQTLTRFTKRGFLRLVVSPDDEALEMQLQLAMPGADDDAYPRALKQHLNRVSQADWSLDTDQSPWTLEAKVSLEEKLEETLDTLQTVSEHVRDAEAGTPLDALTKTFQTAAPTEDEPAEAETSEAAAGEASDSEPAAGGVFESIGTGEPSASEEASGPASEPSGDLVLDRFNLKVSDGTIMARLDMLGSADEATRREFRAALQRSLRARYDVKLLVYDPSDTEDGLTVNLGLEPAALGASGDETVGDLAHTLGRYFERIQKFNDLGMSLLEVLSPGSGSSSSRDERRTEEREQPTEREPEPRLHSREDHRRAESDESGVVFSFGNEPAARAPASGATTLDAESDVLEAGDYTDPRVMRADADTPLVDVVLRHPGYSDRNMRQVLSILLDCDYFTAGKLIDGAPTVIAWSISQERAREFKRVIENAGGKVTLVEPDSL